MSKKLDSPKKKCEHKDISPSSDPLIWYICHDCGAHLNQKFEVIPASYHATVNEVLKTEKIDSETLKRIKNLAQEESDFYDKHGYYSFWSAKLKAQRIKDLEGYKDAKFDLYSSGKDYEIGKVLKQTEKKEVYIPPNINLEGIEESDLFDNQEDSGGENRFEDDRMVEQLPFGEKSHSSNAVLNCADSKLPDLICPFCGRKLIRYKQAWICGHGCTKPALKPIDDLEKDSRSEKELPNRETAFYEASYGINGKPNVLSSKLPEHLRNCDNCKYGDTRHCIHEVGNCTNYDKWEPKEKSTEPEFINTSEPLYPKVVYQLGSDSKEYVELKKKHDKLIEGFIKFIDRFEESYEGNKCGECLEYWKTIKEHYKGA